MPLPAAGLQFLRDLENHNDRDWFQPRKHDYETLVREPVADIVASLNKQLAADAPDYITDPSKAIYRVYRDTRFSADKTPYKTHIGALLWHRRLGKNGGAALYFHISTKELLVAGGLYRPSPDVLVLVREHIAAEYIRLDAILRKPDVRKLLGGLQGDQLTRPPKGWTTDHPAVDYLKRKDLLLETTAPAEQIIKSESTKWLGDRFRAMAPFVEFLNEPLLRRAGKPRDPLL